MFKLTVELDGEIIDRDGFIEAIDPEMGLKSFRDLGAKMSDVPDLDQVSYNFDKPLHGNKAVDRLSKLAERETAIQSIRFAREWTRG
jgi:hypothetical protein